MDTKGCAGARITAGIAARIAAAHEEMRALLYLLGDNILLCNWYVCIFFGVPST